LLGDGRLADVVSAEADGGDALTGAAERTVDHSVVGRGLGMKGRVEKLLRGYGCGGGFDESATVDCGLVGKEHGGIPRFCI
jgi:hypothetical protein